ncbi:hypothetical protein FVE85_8246 [Porphyridium purpureum]|uniref:Uncharacterized protein n=1 Tax=Porphyridium purpureum TaxID=35688 RepID=A0A5J4YM30_PORPP|nr:hypothetical protein FVE85_8246 [Porphyridium purpureum]|eukprot:POR1615..scf244_11
MAFLCGFAPAVNGRKVSASSCRALAMANGNNVLARQGRGAPLMPGSEKKIQDQKAGGVKGGIETQAAPSYMAKVPSKPATGDLRFEYQESPGPNFLSSQGNLNDILSKVPKKPYGAAAYQKHAYRPQPSRQAGFDNSAYSG